MEEEVWSKISQSRSMVKLWESFSLAASGVCQLYKGKLEQSTDVQRLIDALVPMDQFFRGSQKSVELAVSNGKFCGARCVRLQLRDLAYATRQTVGDTTDDMELIVPIRSLIPTFRVPITRWPLNRRRGKRCQSHRNSAHRAVKRCRHNRHKFSSDVKLKIETADADCPYTAPLRITVSPQAESGPIVTTDSCLHVDPLGRSHRRRRRSQSISIHQPPDDDASIDPWHDSTLTCQSDQHRVTLGWDPFKVFQDAVHMTNLLDPFSKFSVTARTDDATFVAPPTAKRSRLDLPTEQQKPAAGGYSPLDM